jgi:hypothetical protein
MSQPAAKAASMNSREFGGVFSHPEWAVMRVLVFILVLLYLIFEKQEVRGKKCGIPHDLSLCAARQRPVKCS